MKNLTSYSALNNYPSFTAKDRLWSVDNFQKVGEIKLD